MSDQAMQARLERLLAAIARASNRPNNAFHAHSMSRDYGTIIGIASTFNGQMEAFVSDMEQDYLGDAIPPADHEGDAP